MKTSTITLFFAGLFFGELLFSIRYDDAFAITVLTPICLIFSIWTKLEKDKEEGK